MHDPSEDLPVNLQSRLRKPPWLKRRALTTEVWQRMKPMLDGLSLATICEEAECPNIGECFRRRTATFLILGRSCTRNCRFCAVEHGRPEPVDRDEPHHLVEAVRQLGLRHVVITSVTRDDLPDGGAAHFAACLEAVHYDTLATAEVLVPDFQGERAPLQAVLGARPDVLGHNVEVVPRLYPKLRPQADYKRSLQLLERSKVLRPSTYTKSSLMVGVGEQEQEVIRVMRDLHAVDCDFLTIGQYLRPSARHYPVLQYVHPAILDRYAQAAKELGFRAVLCGPFVRSSYRAGELLENARRAAFRLPM
ncbi:MAG TPA: lipoyl synthase [Anaerolineae bacterium]|nr:lipoyl synthase [Anaerolineae bacterium]